MVVLEAAAIGAAGYGVYRGGDAVARKGKETLKEHRRERQRHGQRNELAQKTKERKNRLAEIAMMRTKNNNNDSCSSGKEPSATASFLRNASTASINSSTRTTSSTSTASTNSSSSSSVLDRMRAEHGKTSGGGRLKSLFKKK